jgi:hypothetical protein
MTPERREFALLRLRRLREKLVKLETIEYDETVEFIVKQKNSTRLAIKRWEAELASEEFA